MDGLNLRQKRSRSMKHRLKHRHCEGTRIERDMT